MRPERTDEEILEALERWLKRVKDPESIMIGIHPKGSGGKLYSFNQVVQEVRNKTDFGKKWLISLRDNAEKHGSDVIAFIDKFT